MTQQAFNHDPDSAARANMVSRVIPWVAKSCSLTLSWHCCLQAAEADGGGGHGGCAAEVHIQVGGQLPGLQLPAPAAHHADAQRLARSAAHAGAQAVRPFSGEGEIPLLTVVSETKMQTPCASLRARRMQAPKWCTLS